MTETETRRGQRRAALDLPLCAGAVGQKRQSATPADIANLFPTITEIILIGYRYKYPQQAPTERGL
jgi:hypothetical protein